MKRIPYTLLRILKEKTGRSRYIITKTMNGQRVDVELMEQISEIIRKRQEDAINYRDLQKQTQNNIESL